MSASVYPFVNDTADPEKCWNGYTLFGGAGGVRIVDMNGNTANLWEGLAGHPVKMLPGGHVIGSSGRQDRKSVV